jgi:hypothetical protein
MINVPALIKFLWIGLLVITTCSPSAQAFSTVDEQIDDYLEILEYNTSYKREILEQMRWSGITDVRLYDEVEKQLLAGYLRTDLDKSSRGMLAHLTRALAYSGNNKYRSTLELVRTDAAISKVRNHAKKALIQLDDYIVWNDLIADSDVNVEGKHVEEATYMKMLSTDNVMVQRLAARGIFHDKQLDPDLLALAAEKLRGLYWKPGLDSEAQDTVAWLCKAIGQSGWLEYKELLSRVAAKSPYKKIKKYAKKYAS